MTVGRTDDLCNYVQYSRILYDTFVYDTGSGGVSFTGGDELEGVATVTLWVVPDDVASAAGAVAVLSARPAHAPAAAAPPMYTVAANVG